MPDENTIQSILNTDLVKSPGTAKNYFGRLNPKVCEASSHENLRINLSDGRTQCLGCRRVFYNAFNTPKAEPAKEAIWEDEIDE